MEGKEEGGVTQAEQAFAVASRYLHGSDIEREAILSCFTDEEKKTFVNFIGYYKLFSDQKYFDAVKSAVCGKLLKDIYG